MKAISVVLGTTMGVALAAVAACSSPAEPPAKGGLDLSISAYSPMPVGSACGVAGVLDLPAPPETTPSDTDIGSAIIDGKDGAEVTCQVHKNGDGFDVS